MMWCFHFWPKEGGTILQEQDKSNFVKSIKIEVISGEKKDVNLLTQFSEDETIEILKKCLISLEGEASQNRSTN